MQNNLIKLKNAENIKKNFSVKIRHIMNGYLFIESGSKYHKNRKQFHCVTHIRLLKYKVKNKLP